MKRSSERLIDAFVMMMLLIFAVIMRYDQPALAGVIVMAGLKFWMDKNASEPHVSLEEAAARAAAEVLRVARETAVKSGDPDQVEIVGEVDVVPAKPTKRRTS